MLDDFLTQYQSDDGEEKFLWETTRARFDSLKPGARDAAYRCAIVHWFNAEIIAALVGSGHLAHLGGSPRPASRDKADKLYAKLQELSTVEDYGEEGHAFHPLTRQMVLGRLWTEEEAFFRAVSEAAATYFDERWQVDPEQPELEALVEWLYHLLVVDEAAAQANIDYLINDPGVQIDAGLLEAVLDAVEEQATGGRLSGDVPRILPLWQAQVAFRTGENARAEAILAELLAGEDVPDWLSAPAALLLGDIVQPTRPDAAEGSYAAALAAYERLESVEDQVLTLVRLSDCAYAGEHFESAQGLLLEALARYMPLLIVPPEEALEEEIHLNVYAPDAWQRVEMQLEPGEEGEETSGPEGKQEGDVITLYFVELVPAEGAEAETQADAAETEGASESAESVPGWPVEYTGLLAEIWLKLGFVSLAQDEYRLAAAAGRLGGEMAFSLGDLYGAQRAAKLLQQAAAILGDHELTDWCLDFHEKILGWAVEQGDEWTELECLLTLGEIALTGADRATAQTYYQDALERAEALSSLLAQVSAREGLARVAWLAGDRADAEELLRETLDLLPRPTYDENRAWLLSTLGDLALERHHPAKARTYYEEAHTLFSERNLPVGMSHTAARLGSFALDRFSYDEAETYLTQAIDIARSQNLRATLAAALADLAVVNDVRGREDVAAGQYEEAIAISREIDSQAIEARCVHGLGRMKAEMDDAEGALQDYERAVALYEQLGDEDGRLAVLLSTAEAEMQQEAFAEAAATGEEAVALARRISGRRGQANALMTLGLIQLDAQQAEAALGYLRDAAALEPRDSTIIGNLGWAYYEAGDYQTSLTTCLQALDLDPENTWHYRNIGHAYLALSEPEQAEENYRKAIALHHEGEHFKETIKVIRKLLEARPDTPRGQEMLQLFEETQEELERGKAAADS